MLLGACQKMALAYAAYTQVLDSCLMSHVSCLMSHVSCPMSHVSYLNLMSHVACLMSHVSCRMSHVLCLMSHVSCLISPVSCLMSPFPPPPCTPLTPSIDTDRDAACPLGFFLPGSCGRGRGRTTLVTFLIQSSTYTHRPCT